MANVDICTNPNPFNFLTVESKYIKKLEYQYIIFKIEGIHESNYFQAQKSENMIPVLLRPEPGTPQYLFGQNPYGSIYGLESEYIYFLP